MPTEFINNAFAELQETIGRTAANQRAVLDQIGDMFEKVSKENIEVLKSQYAQSRADLAPFMQAGTQGSRYLQILLGMGDPGGPEQTITQKLDPMTMKGLAAQAEHYKGVIKDYQKQIDKGVGNKAETEALIKGYQNQINDLENQVKAGTRTVTSKTGGQLVAGSTPAEQQQNYINQIMDSPYVRSQIKMGTDAVQRSAVAKGMSQSGRVLEDLQRMGQDVASAQIASVQNALMGMMQSGAQAGGATAALSQQLGKDIVGQKQYGLEGKASALNQSAQVYTQSEMAMAQNKFQAALSGQIGPTSGDAGGIMGGLAGVGSLIGMFL